MGVETRRLLKKNKNSPPVFSHEFVIQNHGDISSVILMIIFLAFMWQGTTHIAAVFVIPQYNETVNATIPGTTTQYSYDVWRAGIRDVFTVLFYTVACVTVHAIIQEYVIDKLVRKACRDNKLSISKTKGVKLNESGQLIIFWAYTLAHAVYILGETFTQYNDLQKLWTNYPIEHRGLSLRAKFFFIIQLSYWLHQFPEFYLQKYKSDECRARTLPTIVNIVAITVAYALNFNRLATVIIAIEAVLGVIFHSARILHFIEMKTYASKLFKLWNLLFVLGHSLEAAISAIVFWHGLKLTEVPYIDWIEGNFNTTTVRLNCLIGVFVLQAYFFLSFARFHYGRIAESWSKKTKKTTPVVHKTKKRDEEVKEDSKKDN